MLPDWLKPLALNCSNAAQLFAADVHFAIDAAADVHAISRFIYGVNESLTGAYSNLTLTRSGGNRWTAYNWENNASNAGSDWFFENDNFLGGGNTPGGAIVPDARQRLGAQRRHADHHPDQRLRLGRQERRRRRALHRQHVERHRLDAGHAESELPRRAFRQELARKPGGAFTLTPDTNDPYVYEDEFVNWVKTNYRMARPIRIAPIWFALDNEPGPVVRDARRSASS